MGQLIKVPVTRHSYVEVDLQAIQHNVTWLGSLIAPGTRQMAVVKGDAYGHGAVEVARALSGKVSWFGVANAAEALELRNAGISEDVMVFGVPDEVTAPLYGSHNLTAVISHPELLPILPDGVSAHLLFDTGMGRLGLQPDQIEEVHDALKQSNIRVSGIMSHFPCADDPDSTLAQRQLEQFREISARFPSEWDRHIHNTGGILYHYESDVTMVRHGIGMYGYDPGPAPRAELTPALSWKSNVVQCKPLKKGQTISYGARWEADRDGWLLTVPVGYADGLPRNLTDKISYRVGESTLPVCGTITMDYTMLFSDDPVKPGTSVTVLGAEVNDARVLAESSGTITYELLTRIAAKVPRVYKQV